jgi:16S rRNA (cytosine1402-N4)-methyltransferase
MTAGASAVPAPGGAAARHVPVLLRAVIEYLAPRDGGTYIDATYGAGGYTGATLRAADARVIGIDRDPDAIARGRAQADAAGGRLTLVEGEFAALDAIASAHGADKADGIVFDLGVSSMQLDAAARGFSFRHDGPLDMRMGAGGPSAADILAAAGERDLADIIFALGEERRARAIARAIVTARRKGAIDTTGALAALVARVVPARPGAIHPATRTFQALRMFVNDELGQLEAGLAAAERILKPGARLVVVSFHSLEDRVVKVFLAGNAGSESRHVPPKASLPARFDVLTRRPVTPDAAEIGDNPRARSAKLRAAARTATPARPVPDLTWRAGQNRSRPSLPSLADVLRGE